jgi:hypothetical protein
MAIENSIPRKVLAKAHRLGVHNDCLVAGAGNECASCNDNLMLAFEFFYGDLPTLQEMIRAVTEDFRHDLEEDLSA